MVFLTVFCVGLGLLIAVLVDRVRFESVAKSVIFLPLAISMVAAGVIWRFMYAYEAPGTPQTGFLNGVLAAFGVAPVPWLTIDTLAFNTILLIIVMTWMWTGFAMVILSAALKGISAELLEAARVDGATEWRVFRYITFPLLLPTIAVVSTTIIITALKAFDIVYTMTNGAFDTDNIALLMYKTMNDRRIRQVERRGGRPPAGDRPDHGAEHQPVPGPGGGPMTAAQNTKSAVANTAVGSQPSPAGRITLNFLVILLMAFWLIPTIGLLVNSFRPAADVANSGWWTGLLSPTNLTLDNYREVLGQSGLDRCVHQQPVHHHPLDDHPDLRRGVRRVRVRVDVRSRSATSCSWWWSACSSSRCRPRSFRSCGCSPTLEFSGSFLSVWLAHTAYGLPFAIYLLRNFMGSLPKEVFESAAIDGANPAVAFFRLAIPMSVPALAALAIFQFLFVWNDLLVALIYLGAVEPGEPAVDGRDREPRQLARERLVPPGCRGVHLDGAAVARLLRAPAVLRPGDHRRSRQGLTGWPGGWDSSSPARRAHPGSLNGGCDRGRANRASSAVRRPRPAARSTRAGASSRATTPAGTSASTAGQRPRRSGVTS